MDSQEIDQFLKPVLLKDLRINCRERGLNPAGGKEALSDRIKEHMLATGNFIIHTDDGKVLNPGPVIAGVSTEEQVAGHAQNNYSRPAGQNVGNFLTDRPSSRVMAPPGGGSQIVFGDYQQPQQQRAPQQQQQAAQYGGPGATPYVPSGPAAPSVNSNSLAGVSRAASDSNNYARPGGQNVGNFLTDRHTVRNLAPPGGASSITFG